MSRYFIALSYRGTDYSGFQAQHNANTIQAEVEKALLLLRKEQVVLVGSSRTDSGVHAFNNFFHFDTSIPLDPRETIYKLNAILPRAIAIQDIIAVGDDAHCRFDAISREYAYAVYQHKDPFRDDRAYYFPYKLDVAAMQAAAEVIKGYSDFTAFSKRNTQVKNFNCVIMQSQWVAGEDGLVYQVTANRFLRGMVRALTSTMLKVGRGKISLAEFGQIIESKDCTRASFAVPAHGLTLIAVSFADGLLPGAR